MVKSKYKTVIWDWNGTLLNDIQTCIDITNTLLTKHNHLQLTKSSYKDVFGFPITAYYQRIGMNFEIESFKELTNKFITQYNRDVLKCNLQDHAISVLNSFQTHKISQFILTAAHKESVVALLNHFDIHNIFKAVEGLDNFRAESKIERGKYLLNSQNIDKNTTVLIGDTIHDFEVASALNVDCILIANGHQSKNRLLKSTGNKALIVDDILYLK